MLGFLIRKNYKFSCRRRFVSMDEAKKVLLSLISVAGAIYSLYEFYKKHEDEIKAIIEPAIAACKEVKDLAVVPAK